MYLERICKENLTSFKKEQFEYFWYKRTREVKWKKFYVSNKTSDEVSEQEKMRNKSAKRVND